MDYTSGQVGAPTIGGQQYAKMQQLAQQQGQTQVQYGVSSGFKDIQSAVEQIVNTVDNLRSSLGISIAKMEQDGGVPEQPTLATQLRSLSRRLGSANAELGEVLIHLNS
jgi:hypothetical protein